MVPPHWDRIAIRIERIRIAAPDPAKAAGDPHLMDQQDAPSIVGAPIGRGERLVADGQTRS